MEQPREKRETAAKAAELFNTNRSYINDAATHESGDFGVCGNLLPQTRNEHANAAVTKTAELVLTSRKTGWLTSRTFTSFSPCTKPTTLHVVCDIFYSTICSALTIRFCRVTDTSLTVTLLKPATKLPGKGVTFCYLSDNKLPDRSFTSPNSPERG